MNFLRTDFEGIITSAIVDPDKVILNNRFINKNLKVIRGDLT